MKPEAEQGRMAEVLFYHLTESRMEDALPSLLEKSLERGWRVGVQLADSARMDSLDTQLWTYRDDSFLPHGTDAGELPQDQPILLTVSGENANNATVRFCVDGVEAPEDLSYERVVFVFDGHDQVQLDTARAQWKKLKGAGHSLTYWQQSPEGRWQKKA